MLVKFTVGNYLSFKDKQTIDFIPSSIRELEHTNVVNNSEFNDLRLLKSIGIYGANASGKSNLLKAINFVKKFATLSAISKQATELIRVEPFRLSTTTIDKPSFFEIEFCIKENRYRYNIEVDQFRVHSERLYVSKKNKEQIVYERTNCTEYTLGKSFRELHIFQKYTRENSSFLSVISQFNYPMAGDIVNWLSQMKVLLDQVNDSYINYTAKLINDVRYKNTILKLLMHADLSIDKIKTKRIDREIYRQIHKELKTYGGDVFSDNNSDYEINTVHKVYNESGTFVDNVDFNLLANESEGTRKFFAMAGRISEVLINGSILIIDELDARLHPLLSMAIVKYFNSTKHNKTNAQLIFVTHNASLLSNNLLRRDQIYLTEKNHYEESQIRTLSSLGARNDASYIRNYLKGNYGAVPNLNIADQLELFEEDTTEID